MLVEFNKNLHAMFYLHELQFGPSGVSFYRLYAENDPQEGIKNDTNFMKNDDREINSGSFRCCLVVSGNDLE